MSTPNKDFLEETKLLVRLPKPLHRQVRLLAYDLNVSMAELCRQGLELIIQKHVKSFAKKHFPS